MPKALEVLEMTQQELSALISEVQQLKSEHAQIDDRMALTGVILMDVYPIDNRPDPVTELLRTYPKNKLT